MFSETNVKSNRFVARQLQAPIKELGEVKGTVYLDLGEASRFSLTAIGNITFVVSDEAVVDTLELTILNETATFTFPANFNPVTTTIDYYTKATWIFTSNGKVWTERNFLQSKNTYTPRTFNPYCDSCITTVCKTVTSPFSLMCNLGYANGETCANCLCFCSYVGTYCYMSNFNNWGGTMCTTMVTQCQAAASYSGKWQGHGEVTCAACRYGCCWCFYTSYNYQILTVNCGGTITPYVYSNEYPFCQLNSYGTSVCSRTATTLAIDDDGNTINLFTCFANACVNRCLIRSIPGYYNGGAVAGMPSSNAYRLVPGSCCNLSTFCSQDAAEVCSAFASSCSAPFILGWSSKCQFALIASGTNCSGCPYTKFFKNLNTTGGTCFTCCTKCGAFFHNATGEYYVSFDAMYTPDESAHYFYLSVWRDSNYNDPTSVPCLSKQLDTGAISKCGCNNNLGQAFRGGFITCDGCYAVFSWTRATCYYYNCCDYCTTAMNCSEVRVYCRCSGSTTFCDTPTCFTGATNGSSTSCGWYDLGDATGIWTDGYCYTQYPTRGVVLRNNVNCCCYYLCYNTTCSCWVVDSNPVPCYAAVFCACKCAYFRPTGSMYNLAWYQGYTGPYSMRGAAFLVPANGGSYSNSSMPYNSGCGSIVRRNYGGGSPGIVCVYSYIGKPYVESCR